MHGAVRLFPSLFAGSDREKIRSAAAASAGVRTRVRTHNGFGIPPGESGRVTLTADRRLLARFDGTAGQWRINQGGYHVVVARAPMTHTSRQTRSWPKHSSAPDLRELRVTRACNCALRDQMLLASSVVGWRAPPVHPGRRRGRAPGHSAHSSPRSPQPSRSPYDRHEQPPTLLTFSCSRWCYRSPRRRNSCRPGASLSHSSCRAAHLLTCR